MYTNWQCCSSIVDTYFYFQKLHTLRQLSTVDCYKKQFELLTARYSHLEEDYFVSCCIKGFIVPIQEVVKLFYPSSVAGCFNIARLHESLLAHAATSKTEVIMEYDNVFVHPDIVEANCVEVESLVHHEGTSIAVTSGVPVSTSCVPVESDDATMESQIKEQRQRSMVSSNDDSNILTEVVSSPSLMDISGMKLLGYAMAVVDATPQDIKAIEAPLCSNANGLACAPAIAHSRKTDQVVASMSAVDDDSVQAVAPVKTLVPVLENCVGNDLCSNIVCIKQGQFDMGLNTGYATILDKGGTVLRLSLVSNFATVFCSTYSLPLVAPISKCAIDAVDFANDHSILCDEESRVPTNSNLDSGAKSSICVMDSISISVVVSDLPIGGLYMLIVEAAACVSSMLVVPGAKVWVDWSGDACVHSANIRGKGGTNMLPTEFVLLGSNVHSHIPPTDCCPDISLDLTWWWQYAITIGLVHNSSCVGQACSIAVLA